MRLRVVSMIVCTAVLLLMGTDSHAVYNGGGHKQTLANPTRLVIKFKSDVVLNLKRGSDGYIVTGRPDVDALNRRYQVKNQAPLLHAEAIRTPDNPLRNVHLLDAGKGTDFEGMAHEYEQLDIVEYACPDYPLELYEVPDDPLYPHQWALNNTGQEYYSVQRNDGDYNDVLILETGTPDADIDAEEVYVNPPDQTSAVVVAIIDTGIDRDHPDLAPVVWQNPGEIPDNGLDDDDNGYVDDVAGWDFTGWDLSIPGWSFFEKIEDNDPTDTHGHGTHCAGIVAAVINNGVGVCGVVPQAQIMGVKVDPSLGSMSCAAKGIVYAADNGADVVSMSWGTFYQLPVVEQAVAYARSRGVVLVAANGNDGVEQVNYPTGYSQTISVGATSSLDQITSFSTFSSNISICAPGLSILSLRADTTDIYADQREPNVHIVEDFYYLASGTSMAAPYVAAQAAYLRSVSPGLKPEVVQDIIQSTADDIIDPFGTGGFYVGWDKYSGYGRINLVGALAVVPRASAVISAPLDFDIVSGDIGIIGTADGNDFTNYVLEYSTGDDPSNWINISGSSVPVNDGLLGTLSTGGLEGVITIRLRVDDYSQAMVHVYVDGGEYVRIVSPAEGETAGDWINVTGTALCPDLTMSILSYGVGSSPAEWVPIDTVTAPIHESLLTQWITEDLADGLYSLRLEVFSSAGLFASHTVTINLQSPFSTPDGWSIDMGESLNRTANVADLDNDGNMELLIGTASTIKAYGADGTLKTDLPVMFPSANFTYVPIAVGTLDDDGIDDFVAVSNAGTIYAYPSADKPIEFVAATPLAPSTCYYDYNEAAVYLKDIDADGIDEIHYYSGRSGTGAYQMFDIDDRDPCELVVGSTELHCLPADLDGDGLDEVYCVSDGRISQYDYCNGLVRTEQVLVDGLEPNGGSASMTAADIDDDGADELIIYLSAYSAPWEPGLESWLYAYDEGLTLMEGWPHNTGLCNFYLPVPPVFGDLDSDGILEYVAAQINGVFAWRLDGTPFLEGGSETGFLAVTSNPGTINSLLIADVDGDNQPDILSYTMYDTFEGNWVERIEAWDRWGNIIDGFPLLMTTQSNGGGHTPVIGDLDADGRVDLLTSTTAQTLKFRNLADAEYQPELGFCPTWRYNRERNLSLPPAPPVYVCGDADGDGVVTQADIVYLIDYLHNDGPAPVPFDAGDADGDGDIDKKDANYLRDYLLRDGPEPICP